MTTTLFRTWRRSARALSGWAAALALTGPVVACNDLRNALDVTAPDKIDAASLRTPGNALLLVNSTQGDFECAWGAFVTDGALMSGELMDASLTAARWSLPRRAVDPSESFYSLNECDALGVYTPISRARYTADTALTLLKGWTDAEVPNRQVLLTRAAIYAGYDYIMLGEMFCNAAVDVGPSLTSAQLFALAEDRFTQAIATATTAGNDSLKTIAYAGRARARLDKGDAAGADADAKLVPPGFKFLATTATTTSIRNNRVFAQQNGEAVSVAPPYRHVYLYTTGGDSVLDPRVAVDSTGKFGGDRVTPMVVATQYPTGNTPFVVSSYAEMQLIRAEAEGGSSAVSIINALRQAAVPSAQPITAVTQDTIANERARQLFLQGAHAFDVRRLGIPLNPAEGTPYPNGGVYGAETCLPLPDVEALNNPNIKGS
jgi:hypothetical protein